MDTTILQKFALYLAMQIDEHVNEYRIQLFYTLPLSNSSPCVGVKSGSSRCLRLKAERRQSEIYMSFGADTNMEWPNLRVNIEASMHDVSKQHVKHFLKNVTWFFTP